ncbi:MAG: DUF1549 domain-containing protein, partial [Planctomycetia bacterium]|nr:DUF1549 domain-containing protein [Planctomycetia bacterium]
MKPATASALRLSFLALILVLPADAVGQSAEGIEFFEKKIRPLLIDQCHKCHAGDKVKGSLRLDSGEAIRKGGDNGTAIVAGDPDKSLLIKAVRYQDELRMPPRSKLSDQQIADLTAWVKMGAPWPASFEKKAGIAEAFNLLERKSKHWCWQPIKAENPPAGGGDWVRSPIDAFIQAKLQASGLKPAPAADRRTLIRRVYFDLIGLPPTPAQLDAALN